MLTPTLLLNRLEGLARSHARLETRVVPQLEAKLEETRAELQETKMELERYKAETARELEETMEELARLQSAVTDLTFSKQ